MQYSEYIVDQILDLIADGWTLEKVHSIDGMPSRTQFLTWRRKDAKLSARYEKAIQDRVAYSFDKLTDIAYELLDPENDKHKRNMTEVRAATDILLKLMGAAAGIVQGFGTDDKKTVPHIKIEFVESNEEPPPEAL